ncbi:MAG: peptidoglycan editing factor PgeF [Balneolaceae bacterium]
MSSQINFIKPDLLNGAAISSWFTLRNPELTQSDQQVHGLNLGLNTNENKWVVEKSRRLLLNEIGLKKDEIAFGTQIHKTEVKLVKKGGTYADTDAFVTNVQGLALAIQVADCAAILLGDEDNAVIGAAHAGWRGAVGGVVLKTIQKMKVIGAEPKFIKAFISPCISLEHFEVGEEVAGKFPEQFVDRENFSKPHVALKAFLQSQLLEAGVAESNVEVDEGCTISDEQFYSYRRQKEKSGRMMGIIKLN